MRDRNIYLKLYNTAARISDANGNVNQHSASADVVPDTWPTGQST